jgi:hypothetical protein
MKTVLVFLLSCLILSGCGKAPEPAPQKPSAQPNIGDRLPPVQTANSHSPQSASLWRTIEWEDLMPKDWDPAATLKGMDFSTLKDNDPRAQKALIDLKAAWDKAPTNPALSGQRIRLAGFVIPLERQGEAISELLLLPYFGACIHVPPPPANQVIHVILNRPAKDIHMMDAFWISGTLTLQRGDSSMGFYGYQLLAEAIEVYPLEGGE